MRVQILFFSFLAGLVLLGAACGPTGQQQGGIHRSDDAGMTWQPANQVGETAGPSVLSRANITDLALDPSNHSIVYASTLNQGLFRSIDGAQSWSLITTRGAIHAFDIHPSNPQRLAAARGAQIFLTSDGGQVWQLAYTNPSSTAVTDLKFDVQDTRRIYASLATGELLKTDDNGQSWTSLHTFEEAIRGIKQSARRPSTIYIVSPREGIFRSEDKGLTWQLVTDGIQRPLDTFTNPLLFLELSVHAQNASDLLLRTSNGLYTSNDAGDNWQPFQVLTEDDKRQVRAIAWDPTNRQRVYYATNSVFYRSDNFGQSWSTVPFAADRPPAMLIIDPESPQRLYLGTRAE